MNTDVLLLKYYKTFGTGFVNEKVSLFYRYFKLLREFFYNVHLTVDFFFVVPIVKIPFKISITSNKQKNITFMLKLQSFATSWISKDNIKLLELLSWRETIHNDDLVQKWFKPQTVFSCICIFLRVILKQMFLGWYSFTKMFVVIWHGNKDKYTKNDIRITHSVKFLK